MVSELSFQKQTGLECTFLDSTMLIFTEFGKDLLNQKKYFGH
jgi:hypothetical protein